MPVDVQYTEFASDFVSLENLERYNGGIAEHVSGNTAVENLKRAVVTGICKQGVTAAWVELDSTDGLAVVAQSLIRTLR